MYQLGHMVRVIIYVGTPKNMSKNGVVVEKNYSLHVGTFERFSDDSVSRHTFCFIRKNPIFIHFSVKLT